MLGARSRFMQAHNFAAAADISTNPRSRIRRPIGAAYLALSILALCASAAPAHALDRDSFLAKVQQYTTAYGKPIRTLCICKESGDYCLEADYLISGPAPAGNFLGVSVGCAVPRFYASDGSSASAVPCNSNFEVLTK